MKYKYLFGPVLSRRLGVSLGIDLFLEKNCNLNCIYCECGKSSKKVYNLKNINEEIINELDHFLKQNSNIDVITFAGSGEPLLYEYIEELIREIKKITDLKVVILTNGTLLIEKVKRKNIKQADIVIPSLDSATKQGFYMINKPKYKFNIEEIIKSLSMFKNEFNGEMYLEILFVKGINDSVEEISKLEKAINRIKPDKIQLNTVDRPPAFNGTKGLTYLDLQKIKEKLNCKNVEIVKKYKVREKLKNYDIKNEDLILNMLLKRPCTIVEISEITKIEKSDLQKYFDILEKENKVEFKLGERGIFVKGI